VRRLETEERKEKRNLLDLDENERFVLVNPEPIEIASGYSISIKYDKKGRPNISVKKYGDVDTRGIRREIERNYPGAEIQGLESSVEIDDIHEDTSKGVHKPKRRKRRKT